MEKKKKKTSTLILYLKKLKLSPLTQSALFFAYGRKFRKTTEHEDGVNRHENTYQLSSPYTKTVLAFGATFKVLER